MNEAASVFLRTDIQRQDGLNLANWMCNKNIIRYLNEQNNVSHEVLSLLERTPEGMLTYHFNQHGRFFLICGPQGQSIGFVKLASGPKNLCEVVYVIGEEKLWGCGYGKRALRLALSKAFLEMRSEVVVAKIHKDNMRSIHTARHCGMKPVRESGHIHIYQIAFKEYAAHMQK